MKQTTLFTAISGVLSISALSIELAQAGNSVTVTSISDQPEQGLTTLREAIAEANTIANPMINFDQTLFSVPQTILLENGELLISTNTTINGPGKDLLTVDGNENSRIFRIDDETDALINVEISGVTLTRGNGSSPADTRTGGCVLSFESLTLNDSVVTQCDSVGNGGGIFTRFGSLNLNSSTLSANFSGNNGGGLYLRDASAMLSESTLSNNSTLFSGGAVFVSRSSHLELSNSTISDNSIMASGSRGGGIFIDNNTSSLFVQHSTIIKNSRQGVFSRQSSLININNSIIANNTTDDCDFTNINGNSINHNNLDSDGSCDVLASNHFTVIDPRLGPLSYNGGSTMTHLPLPGSPAIDNGDEALCLDFDQRSISRPQDGDGNGSSFCDIGAVESLNLEGDFIFSDGFEISNDS